MGTLRGPWGVVLGLALLGVVWGILGSPYSVYLTDTALLAVIGAIGLNLLVGYSGQVSLGSAAFLAIGAIVAAECGTKLGLSFVPTALISLVVGFVVGAVVGFPALRVRGLYLLLATMALHFVVLFAFLKYQDHVAGVAGIILPSASVFGFVLSDDRQWYWVFLITCLLVVVLVKNILRHADGRALVALRDHEVAASVLGVNVALRKVFAFAVSSALISLSGAFLAYWQTTVSSDNFTFSVALDYLAMIIIGGLASVEGAIVGAFFITLLPTVLDSVTSPLLGVSTATNSILDDLIYGGLILAFLVLKSDGIIGIVRSAADLVRARFAGSREAGAEIRHA